MTTIVETTRIAKDAAALWQEIGQFGAIGDWHPFLAKVESDGELEGSLRTAEGRDGSRQTERLLEIAPDRHFYRYRMEATQMPVRDYVAELRVQDGGDGTSTIIWSADFEPGAGNEEVAETIRGFLRAGLDNIRARYNTRSGVG